MLSPGEYYKSVPKERLANLRFRLSLLRQCKSSRANQKAVIEACRRDILFYINCFVFQFNPKKKGLNSVGPFITYPFQDEALIARPATHGKKGMLWCYENNRSAVIEKSREMGATWLFLIFQDWLCLFHPFVQCLNISKSAEAVDDPSPDSLFWKLRFMHRHLPDWMKGKITETKMYLEYKNTNSVNTGEASTGRAGVGGRAGLIFVDEFSKIREATEIRQRTANTADCRFFNSTHEGTDTEFFRLTSTPEMVKIQMHWTQHPEKWVGAYRYNPKTGQIEVLDKGYPYPPDFEFQMTEHPLGGPFPGVRSPWYDQKVIDIGSQRGSAIELDIDPGGSVSQVFDALTIRQLREEYATGPCFEGDIAVDDLTGKPVGLVPKPGGPLKLWRLPKSDTDMPAGLYVMGADLSTGLGITNSVLSAVDAETGEKILEYATARRRPEEMAPIATGLCWLLKDEYGNPAQLCWEHKGPGFTFHRSVADMNFPNIYRRRDDLGLSLGKVLDTPGWCPQPRTKRVLLDEYHAALRHRKFINRSDIALAECLEYRYDDRGVPEHPGDRSGEDPTGAVENHGDRVIADAIAWMMTKNAGHLGGKAKAQEEETPRGSLAWRRKLLHNRKQQEEYA